MSSQHNHPHGVGLGLRHAFLEDVAKAPPSAIQFYEIAPENYIGRGGLMRSCFEKVASEFPILAHGLSLSIGSLDELNWSYLKKLKNFLREFHIPWFSDHLCFSSHNAHQFHDLLPLPFTWEALKHVSERARVVQDFLEVPFAIENVSYYLEPAKPEMMEFEFIQEILQRSGVKLMLDVNNVYVNHVNHGLDADAFLNSFSEDQIVQIHIAGHFREAPDLIIDTHAERICEDVWSLLEKLGSRIALPPVLIERDSNFPGWDEILNEVKRASQIYASSHRRGIRVA